MCQNSNCGCGNKGWENYSYPTQSRCHCPCHNPCHDRPKPKTPQKISGHWCIDVKFEAREIRDCKQDCKPLYPWC